MGGVEVNLQAFLTSVLDVRESSAWRPVHFNSEGKALKYPVVWRMCGPQSRSGRGGKEINKSPRQESNPFFRFGRSVTLLTELLWLVVVVVVVFVVVVVVVIIIIIIIIITIFSFLHRLLYSRI
jgi:hypothetical protein